MTLESEEAADCTRESTLSPENSEAERESERKKHRNSARVSVSVDQIFPLSASKLFGCDQMIRAQGSDWRAGWLQLHCRLFSGTRSHCFSNIA